MVAGSMRLCLALLLCLICSIQAGHPLGGTLAPSLRKAVADQLVNTDPAKRIGAIVRFRADGSEATDEFRAGLARSEPMATAALRRQMQLVRMTDPSFDAIRKLSEEYRTLAETARVIVLIDHHKDQKKFAEMDKAFAAAEKAYEKLSRALKPGSPYPAVQLLDAVQWAAEVRRDLEFCDGKSNDVSKLPLVEVMETEQAAEPMLAFVKEVEPFLSLREFHRLVSTAHASAKWAKSDQVQYAQILNSRRVVLRLRPFLLADKLSEACFQHSEEMVKLKYFAHESPVPENKTPWDRVKNAKFEGNGGGECIYSGGSAAQAAHTGWWYSDGHRLILYGGGNAQGIARFGGGMWTFMSGTYGKFPM